MAGTVSLKALARQILARERGQDRLSQECPSAGETLEVLSGGIGLREVGDRRQAITSAAALLEAGDILVVAGKGHEQGQTIGDRTIPFDDVAETRHALGLADRAA